MKSFFTSLIGFVIVFAAFAYAHSHRDAVTVSNEGSFVANFTVQYLLQNKNITENSKFFSKGQNVTIFVPNGALDVYVKVQVKQLLGHYKTVYERNFPGPLDQYTWNNTGHLCLRSTGSRDYPVCFEDKCSPYAMGVDVSVDNIVLFSTNFSLRYSLDNKNIAQSSELISSGDHKLITVPGGALDTYVTIQGQTLMKPGLYGYYTMCEKFYPGSLDQYSGKHSGRLCLMTYGIVHNNRVVCHEYEC